MTDHPRGFTDADKADQVPDQISPELNDLLRQKVAEHEATRAGQTWEPLPHHPRPMVAPDGVRCETCGDILYSLDPGGANWSHTDPGPPVHLAAVGLPGLAIQHVTGECAWCDAERWRDLVDAQQATKAEGKGWAAQTAAMVASYAVSLAAGE